MVLKQGPGDVRQIEELGQSPFQHIVALSSADVYSVLTAPHHRIYRYPSCNYEYREDIVAMA
jgi:hypothetical protein